MLRHFHTAAASVEINEESAEAYRRFAKPEMYPKAKELVRTPLPAAILYCDWDFADADRVVTGDI